MAQVPTLYLWSLLVLNALESPGACLLLTLQSVPCLGFLPLLAGAPGGGGGVGGAWGKQGVLVWSHLADCASPMSPLTSPGHSIVSFRSGAHRALGVVSAAERDRKVKAKRGQTKLRGVTRELQGAGTCRPGLLRRSLI